jgi:hypothetical protein
MGSSLPLDSAEEALLERMRTLFAQLDDEHPHTPEYERLAAEIRALSAAYAKLVEAQRSSDPGDPKP